MYFQFLTSLLFNEKLLFHIVRKTKWYNSILTLIHNIYLRTLELTTKSSQMTRLSVRFTDPVASPRGESNGQRSHDSLSSRYKTHHQRGRGFPFVPANEKTADGALNSHLVGISPLFRPRTVKMNVILFAHDNLNINENGSVSSRLRQSGSASRWSSHLFLAGR